MARHNSPTNRMAGRFPGPFRSGSIGGRAPAFKVLVVVIALAAAPRLAQSQDWPTRPMTLVVPFGPGAATDMVGRVLAQQLTEILGPQVLVENIGGAGGMTGSFRVANAAPDGYQFVIGNIGTHAQSQALYKRPLYDAATDFAAVGLTNTGSKILVVRKDLAANNLSEFIAYAKVNQGKMHYGSAGPGSSTHTACMLFNSAIGTSITHVPYRGDSAALEDLIAGRIDYMCEPPSVATQFIQNAAIKAIAVLSLNRLAVLPNLPTAHEQGLKDFEVDAWQGLFFPRKTPEAIVRRLNSALGQALDTAFVRGRFEALGVTTPTPDHRSPEYLARLVSSEIARWTAAFKASGLSID
jgi:tripartite-type tricarboxylate transporter receptor subunit TctC